MILAVGILPNNIAGVLAFLKDFRTTHRGLVPESENEMPHYLTLLRVWAKFAYSTSLAHRCLLCHVVVVRMICVYYILRVCE